MKPRNVRLAAGLGCLLVGVGLWIVGDPRSLPIVALSVIALVVVGLTGDEGFVQPTRQAKRVVAAAMVLLTIMFLSAAVGLFVGLLRGGLWLGGLAVVAALLFGRLSLYAAKAH